MEIEDATIPTMLFAISKMRFLPSFLNVTLVSDSILVHSLCFSVMYKIIKIAKLHMKNLPMLRTRLIQTSSYFRLILTYEIF